MARDLSMMRPIWDSNTERNDATAPKIKAGAAACDITSWSWSIVGRLDNIATSEMSCPFYKADIQQRKTNVHFGSLADIDGSSLAMLDC
jgi:hypothetical protein